MIYAGIDYSLTSPSVAVCDMTDGVFSYEKCKFYYLSKSDRNIINDGVFIGSKYPEYKSEYERYQRLATWTLKIILDNHVTKCYIEDYAFGATGRVFHIAENTGLMKYSLWNMGVEFETFAPTSIKKYATGKGNAKKENLYDKWLETTSINIRTRLNISSEKTWNPVSDIVDAYFIVKMGIEGSKS